MTSKTRRSVSMTGIAYQRLRDHCRETGQSCSSFVQDLVMAKLDELGVPEQTVLKPWTTKTPVKDVLHCRFALPSCQSLILLGRHPLLNRGQPPAHLNTDANPPGRPGRNGPRTQYGPS